MLQSSEEVSHIRETSSLQFSYYKAIEKCISLGTNYEQPKRSNCKSITILYYHLPNLFFS